MRFAARSRILAAGVTVALAIGLGLASPDVARAADSGKKDARKAGLKKNQAWVVANWKTRAIRTIAIAPLRSVERKPEAEILARRMLENALADTPYKYLGPGSVMEAIKRSELETAYAAAGDAFSREAPLDSTTARELRERLQTDALLFTNLINWQRSIVDQNTRGASFTQVAVDVVLYSFADGAIVWQGSFQEKGDGPYNEPRLREGGDVRDPGGNSVARAGSLDPPSFEEVVDKLMLRVAAALPKPAPAAAPAPASD